MTSSSLRLWMTFPRIQSVEFWSLLWRLGTGYETTSKTRCKSRETPPWQAGGVGLNLTTANHVIHFDRCWNPAKEAQAGGPQFSVVVFKCWMFDRIFRRKIPSCENLVSEATDRAHRIGQTSHCVTCRITVETIVTSTCWGGIQTLGWFKWCEINH